jgi:CxxC motif-containing protein (DUF1111 family)
MSASPESARPGLRAACIGVAVAGLAVFGPAPHSSGADLSLDHAIGKALFERAWVSAPASTSSTDGLGPLYNARSCAACHTVARRPPADSSGQALPSAIVFKLVGPAAFDSTYGAQLQTAAVPGLPAEGRAYVDYQETAVTLADGFIVNLRRPTYRLAELGYGPLDSGTVLSPRVPPSLAGLGLLERIEAEAILAWADAEDADGDGISGRPSLPQDCGGARACLGRFGWKAATATIAEQIALAFHLDIGMSTPRLPYPWGDCTAEQRDCRTAPHGAAAAELPPQMVELLDGFMRAQPAPAARDRSPLARQGEAVFAATGCAACHRPSFPVNAADGSTATISPYTDLLLHDVGDGLSDAPGGAGEWRTAPLWGLGDVDRQAGPKAYLHDGRARSLEEAVLWHGGEAETAATTVKGLTAAERRALLEFLRSL